MSSWEIFHQFQNRIVWALSEEEGDTFPRRKRKSGFINTMEDT